MVRPDSELINQVSALRVRFVTPLGDNAHKGPSADACRNTMSSSALSMSSDSLMARRFSKICYASCGLALDLGAVGLLSGSSTSRSRSRAPRQDHVAGAQIQSFGISFGATVCRPVPFLREG